MTDAERLLLLSIAKWVLEHRTAFGPGVSEEYAQLRSLFMMVMDEQKEQGR